MLEKQKSSGCSPLLLYNTSSMRIIELEELKAIQCEILYKIHTFCIDNNINYSLAYGTLIGAVRHKGYIPWDDDIDIMMLRPDYDKFISTFPGVYPELTVCAPEIDLNYYAPYANVWDNRTKLEERTDLENNISIHRGLDIGVKIDIFPMDAVPHKNKRLFVSKYKFLSRLKNSFNAVSYSTTVDNRLSHKILSAIYSFVAHIVGYKRIQKSLMNFAKENKIQDSEKIDLVVINYKERDYLKSYFESYIDMQFEQYTFKSISGYDYYLSKFYGDYMKLPPKEEQTPHHHFKAYWID